MRRKLHGERTTNIAGRLSGLRMLVKRGSAVSARPNGLHRHDILTKKEPISDSQQSS
jgi:hypothetical protein